MKSAIARFMIFVAALSASSACYATKPPPEQYVNIAPLPGDGLALDSKGKPDGQGAMQVNIPVAYTPGARFFSLSAYAGQWTTTEKSNPSWKNGSGTIAFGFGTWPRLYGSGMAVSSLIFSDSKALNAQLQVVEETDKRPAIAVGAQDILDKEGHQFGANYNTGTGYYAVATKRFKIGDKNAFGTLGYGTARFLDRPFAGISVPVSDQFSVAAEYDGFQINAGIGWRPWGRYSPATLLAGWNGHCGPLVGVQGTTQISGWWAVPVFFALERH